MAFLCIGLIMEAISPDKSGLSGFWFKTKANLPSVLLSGVRIVWKRNSSNTLRFSLTRETDTQKRWVILQNFNSLMINLHSLIAALIKLPWWKMLSFSFLYNNFFFVTLQYVISFLMTCHRHKCLISPWGQSWERVFHKHSCIQFCMHLCLWKTLSQDCPHGEIRHLCRWHVIRKDIWYVLNFQIFEFSEYYVTSILIFFNVQNWDSCLKINKYYVIFRKFNNSTH